MHSAVCWEKHIATSTAGTVQVTGFDPLFQGLTDLLNDASRRGEISPARLTPVVLEVLHALIIKRILLETRNLTTKDITEMIDEVLLPLLVTKA